jgi:hypothetical protein
VGAAARSPPSPYPGRAVEQESESPENDLVARVQGLLADDPSSVHEGAVARAEITDTPAVAESLERGVHARDPVGIDDHIVRLERSDGHSLRVQRAQLTPTPSPHLDVAAHDETREPQPDIGRVYVGTLECRPPAVAVLRGQVLQSRIKPCTRHDAPTANRQRREHDGGEIERGEPAVPPLGLT